MECISNDHYGYDVEMPSQNYDRVGVIYSTTDYGMFKELENNRPVDPRNVDRIVENMQLYGVLISPIIVNEKMEVVDGQHRLEAVQRIGEEVYFFIVQGYGDNEIQALNTVSKRWSRKDYIEYYAAKGLETFRDLKLLMAKYSDFPPSAILNAYTIDSSNVSKGIRLGTLQTRDLHETDLYLKELKHLSSVYPHSQQKAFLCAYVKIRKDKELFCPKSFFNKMAKYSTKSPVFARTEQAKEYIENIYNYRRRDKINLRI